MPKLIPIEEKRVPFSCLLPPEFRDEIKERAVGLSQGDVVVAGIMSLRMQEQHVAVGPSKRLSKKAAHVAELKASDPLAEIMEREDIEHGNMELPSSGSIALDALQGAEALRLNQVVYGDGDGSGVHTQVARRVRRGIREKGDGKR